MVIQTHDENTFIGNYARLCKVADRPLCDTQIALLERTITEIFGSPKRNGIQESNGNDLRPLDGRLIQEAGEEICYSQPGRLIGIIRKYKDVRGSGQDTSPISDADALALYELTSREINEDFPALKKKHGLPKTYGVGSFRVLHKYLQRRGLVDESSKSPLPPSFF